MKKHWTVLRAGGRAHLVPLVLQLSARSPEQAGANRARNTVVQSVVPEGNSGSITWEPAKDEKSCPPPTPDLLIQKPWGWGRWSVSDKPPGGTLMQLKSENHSFPWDARPWCRQLRSSTANSAQPGAGGSPRARSARLLPSHR